MSCPRHWLIVAKDKDHVSKVVKCLEIAEDPYPKEASRCEWTCA